MTNTVTTDHAGVRSVVHKNVNTLNNLSAGYYVEYLIENKLTEDIYLLSKDVEHVLPKIAAHSFAERGTVVIQIREHNGVRSFRHGTTAEITPCNVKFITIQESVLDEGPIYVEEIDRVIYKRSNYDHAVHPGTEEFYERWQKFFLDQNTEAYQHAPYRILVNDYLKRFDSFYITMNDRIFTIPVTHTQPLSEEYTTAHVGISYGKTDKVPMVEMYATITIITERGPGSSPIRDTYFLKDVYEDNDGDIWKLGETVCSVNKHSLVRYIDKQKSDIKQNFISIKDHEIKIESAEKINLAKIDILESNAKRHKKMIDDNLEVFTKTARGDNLENSMDLSMKTLELEEDKIKIQRETNKANDSVKKVENITKITVATAKVAVVLIPLAVTLYGLFKK